MKIGLDISQIVYKGTGVGRFNEGLVKSILDNNSKHEWIFFASCLRKCVEQSIESKIKNKGYRIINYRLPPKILSLLWNDFHIYETERIFGHLDWFISSDWTEPPSKSKKATVIHDLVYLRYPETVDKLIIQTQKKRLRWVKNESALIFADSQSTKDDIVNLMQINREKITVNYPGISLDFDGNSVKVKNKYKLRKPFILTVGKIEPRKNIERLIKAFNKLQNEDVDLVIVGAKGWGNVNFDSIGKAKNNIRFLDYVPDTDLMALYSSALVFAYPSIWEGFGYPLVEAMKSGTPTITSNSSSLSEISGNASLFFNPMDIDSITDALRRIINDNRLRKELIIRGLKRSKIFTWKNYYNKMIESLENNQHNFL